MTEPELKSLSGRSLPELREMLQRQERLLSHRAVVSQLSDGGERLRKCAARLRAAVAAREQRQRSCGDCGPAEEPPLAALAKAVGGLSLGTPGAAAVRGRRGVGVRPGGAPRREEDQRPEDASAARPPQLSHAPAQLLPLAESGALQVRQEQARQEMQAKVAAQKLAERLGFKMVRYDPERQMMTSYREIRDEETYSSSED